MTTKPEPNEMKPESLTPEHFAEAERLDREATKGRWTRIFTDQYRGFFISNGPRAFRELAECRTNLENNANELQSLRASNDALGELIDTIANANPNHKGCPAPTDWAMSAVRDIATKLETARKALERLRDCDWVISLPDRMDAVRDIAAAALRETA